MDNAVVERIRVLKTAARGAAESLRSTLREVGQFYHEEMEYPDMIHNNIRIIESDSAEFQFELAQDKHQVVVVLKGVWVMEHGDAERTLTASDTIKVPMGSPHPTLMNTSEVGAKFVYVQFT